MKWIDAEKQFPENNDVDFAYLISDGHNISIGWYEPEFFEKDDPEYSKESGITYSSACWHDDANLLKTGLNGWPEVKFYTNLPELPM